MSRKLFSVFRNKCSTLHSTQYHLPRSFVPDKKSCVFTTLTKTITRMVRTPLMVMQEAGLFLLVFRWSLVMMGWIQGMPKHHSTREKASASEKIKT